MAAAFTPPTGHLLPAFGEMAVEDVSTAVIEGWLAGFDGSTRSRNKLLIQLHGILERARKIYGLTGNAASDVEKFRQRASGDIQVFSPQEVWALVRAAESEQDAAVFLAAAFTGLRMGELLALRWRDVDFVGNVVRVRASYYLGQLTTPKSGKVRAVPLAPAVASALAPLSSRERWTGDDDLVFVGATGSIPRDITDRQLSGGGGSPSSGTGSRRLIPCDDCSEASCPPAAVGARASDAGRRRPRSWASRT